VSVEMQLTDESGNAAFKQPVTGAVSKGVPKQAEEIPLQFEIKLVSVGKYKLELKATDKVSGKRAELSVPLQVLSGG